MGEGKTLERYIPKRKNGKRLTESSRDGELKEDKDTDRAAQPSRKLKARNDS